MVCSGIVWTIKILWSFFPLLSRNIYYRCNACALYDPRYDNGDDRITESPQTRLKSNAYYWTCTRIKCKINDLDNIYGTIDRPGPGCTTRCFSPVALTKKDIWWLVLYSFLYSPPLYFHIGIVLKDLGIILISLMSVVWYTGP